MVNVNENAIFEELIEQFKNSENVSALNKQQKIAQILASSAALKKGKVLSAEEMKVLIDELFACENPYHAPNGRLTVAQFSLDEIEKKFQGK